MKRAVLAAFLLLAACGPKEEERACCAKPPEPQAPAPAPVANTIPEPNPAAFAGIDPQVLTTCSVGLVTRGLEEEEHWLIMHEPAAICPNMGVTEARIREIIAKDWDAAGCTQFTKEQMLNALNTGACGGNAG